jgi:hypothetical protein
MTSGYARCLFVGIETCRNLQPLRGRDSDENAIVQPGVVFRDPAAWLGVASKTCLRACKRPRTYPGSRIAQR